jgi:hypothetical protein
MPPAKDWMSPLRRAESYLAVRLLELERRLPLNGAPPAVARDDDQDIWRDYIDTVAVFAQVRAQLYYAGAAPPAHPARAPAAARGMGGRR